VARTLLVDEPLVQPVLVDTGHDVPDLLEEPHDRRAYAA
jgi:hypothetical protein